MTEFAAVKDAAAAVAARDFDAVLLVAHDPAAVALPPLHAALRALQRADQGFAAPDRATLWPAPGAAGDRLVLAPTGPLRRDHDDVRRYAEAAARGMTRARDAGARSVLLLV